MLLIQAEKRGSDEVGTDAAILCESDGEYPRDGVVNTWGGARNSASRLSESIGTLRAIELVEAAMRAIAIGSPFNRHLTVHWEKGRLTDSQAAEATGRLLKLIRDWARKNGGCVAYAWVRENGPGKGSHTHILLHIPSGLKLKLTRRWYRGSTGWRGPLKKAVKSVCIGRNAGAARSASDHYRAHLANLLAYLLKGADEPAALALGLEDWGMGGSIKGKRVSICQRASKG